MKQFLFFIIIIGIGSNAFGQIEFKPQFKPIRPKTTPVKPKEKDIPPPTNLPKLDIPKIVAPNVLKETNIYGTKPQPNNAFEIGTPENHFSMVQKNKFEHKLGDVYQAKMTKDLDKTMVQEGLKEDTSQLDRTDRYLGEYHTKSEYFALKYRDYIQIDGDLINVYINDKLLRSELYLNYDFGELRIPLTLGFNTIEISIASIGEYGGNTAEIQVLDNVNRVITKEMWNSLALGTKIKMLVIRE